MLLLNLFFPLTNYFHSSQRHAPFYTKQHAIQSTHKRFSLDDPYSLNNLTFNYENTKPLVGTKPIVEQGRLRLSHALCFPQDTRPNGCQPLLSQTNTTRLKKVSSFTPLPCVSGSSCPYKKFRCSKGHEWKAVDGSPVCFYCPICRSADMIRGLKRNSGIQQRSNSFDKDRVVSLILQRVKTNNGSCYNLENVFEWNSKIDLVCKEGHSWKASAVNLIHGKTWCRRCRLSANTLSLQGFQETAERFEGAFVGFVNPVNLNQSLYRQKAIWRCKQGHTFEQYINNIRRNASGARRCSWCPSCKRTDVG